jgi:protein TonB
MRVQRTRVARFARPGSPLTRRPLGGLGAVLVILGISLGAASPTTPVPTPKMVQPQLLTRVEPDVPRELLTAGTPILKARITEKGDVVDIQVIRSVGKDADKYYVNALRRWKYKPATVDGRPVATELTITMMIRPQ